MNGKYCCNEETITEEKEFIKRFNTVNGKYCCNNRVIGIRMPFRSRGSFNTVNGKYCCNTDREKAFWTAKAEEFQYRER